MWANRAWVGRYFPAGTRTGHELAEYATWCPAVEGNTTFYALPANDTVRKWVDMTPTSFRFLFKVPKSITHDRHMRGTDAELTAFLRLLEPLGERLGPFSIQLPPSFGPGDLGLLAAFLRRAPRHVTWSVEVRHPDFFDGGRAHLALDRLLVDNAAERIILDTRTLFSSPPTDAAESDGWRKKPRVPVIPVAIGASPIVRFIGRTSAAETVAGWQPWLVVLDDWIAEGRTPTMFVHTPDNAIAPELVRLLHQQASARIAGLQPLPSPRPAEPGVVQERLFD